MIQQVNKSLNTLFKSRQQCFQSSLSRQSFFLLLFSDMFSSRTSLLFHAFYTLCCLHQFNDSFECYYFFGWSTQQCFTLSLLGLLVCWYFTALKRLYFSRLFTKFVVFMPIHTAYFKEKSAFVLSSLEKFRLFSVRLFFVNWFYFNRGLAI